MEKYSGEIVVSTTNHSKTATNHSQKDFRGAIPAKKLDRNVLIGTWNIRMFGGLTEEWEANGHQSPKRDLHSLLYIVEILRRFDIIAVQEVQSCLTETIPLASFPIEFPIIFCYGLNFVRKQLFKTLLVDLQNP